MKHASKAPGEKPVSGPSVRIFFVVVVPSVYETFISPRHPPGIATQFPRQPGVFDCGRFNKVT